VPLRHSYIRCGDNFLDIHGRKKPLERFEL
jgi:hypothetical protein